MRLLEHIRLADWLREKQPKLLGMKHSEISLLFEAETGMACNTGCVHRMAKYLGLDFTPPPVDSIEQLRKDVQILAGIILDNDGPTPENRSDLARIFTGRMQRCPTLRMPR